MQVNRITLDRELGLIHLETGPGGDGNYVLLPLPVPPIAQGLLAPWTEPDVKQEPPIEIRNANGDTAAIEYPGGWRTHPDQTYEKDYFEKVAAEKAAADEANAKWPGPQSLRGGIKYPKSVNVQAPPAEVPKSATPGCQCGAHKISVVQNIQTAAQHETGSLLAFVRKSKFPTWYVTVPGVPGLRIDDVHSDSIHLIPDMVRAEIDKISGRKITSEQVHLVFPHNQRNPQL